MASTLRSKLGACAVVCVAACSGLDPNDFTTGPTPPMAGQGGYSFNAGGAGQGSDIAPAGGATGAAMDAPAFGGKSSSASSTTSESGASGDDEVGEGGVMGSTSESPGAGGLGGGRASAGNAGSAGSAASTKGSGDAGASSSAGRGGASPEPESGGGSGDSPTPGGQGGGGAGEQPPTGGTAGDAPAPPVHAFWISEYVEGSGSYKALELFAREDSTLDGCRLLTFSNGAASGAALGLSGPVAGSSVYTLCSSALGEVLGAVCDRTTNLGYNGNDAVALECDGELIDVIGQVGFDPGAAWAGAACTTQNATLRRRCGVEAGDQNGDDAFDPDAEWICLPTDSFDGLGDPTCG